MAPYLANGARQGKVGTKVALYGIDGDSRANYRCTAMRILSKKELRTLVLYSPGHIDRLEKSGQFPQRIRLGPGRVGWLENEVLEWLKKRIQARASAGETRES